MLELPACSDGGWIHYRVTCKEHMEDIQKLLLIKCMKKGDKNGL